MGKIHNGMADSKKLNKRHRVLSTIDKIKSKNRRKISGAILPTPIISLKQIDNLDLNLVKPVKKGSQKILDADETLKSTKKSPKNFEKKLKLTKTSLTKSKNAVNGNSSSKKHSLENKHKSKKNAIVSLKIQKNNADKSYEESSKIKNKTKTAKEKLVFSKVDTEDETEDKSHKIKSITSKVKAEKNKITSEIKKTTLFKKKTPTLKVKTELIFNPRAKIENQVADVKTNLNENTVRSGIKALFKLIEGSKNDNALFEDELPIFLQFISTKIGKTPARTLRIPLKHSLLKESSEVCLIVEDMRGRSHKEYEKTLERYENLLKEKDVTNIKTIMTYYQLRTDYSEFELKRKLVELYDVFLVDAKLSGYVVKKLGKIFRDKRKLPIPIRLEAKNLKEHIKFALSKTSTNIHSHGDNFVIQIAHSDMTEDQIYDNVVEATKKLSKEFPGGWENIRGLNLKTPKSTAVPIYYIIRNPAEVPVPIVKPKRSKAYKTLTDELSTAYDRNVTVLPTGTVILNKPEKAENKKTIITNNVEKQNNSQEEQENAEDSNESDFEFKRLYNIVEKPKKKILKKRSKKAKAVLKLSKILKKEKLKNKIKKKMGNKHKQIMKTDKKVKKPKQKKLPLSRDNKKNMKKSDKK